MSNNIVDTDYLKERIDDQIDYFDKRAIFNQIRYKVLKRISISCNVLTTMTIALAFTVPEYFKLWMGILALVLSTIVLATYQWEEFESYGGKWEKFRIVAESLKSEKIMFETQSGKYAEKDDEKNFHTLVESVERIIKGTDVSYFSLLVEPGKRIEKRLDSVGHN